MAGQQLQKAVITKLQPSPQKSVTCQYNPTELSLNKRVSWTPNVAKDKNVPNWSFGGGEAADMTVSLLFDTTSSGKDVRSEYTNFLLDLVKIDTKLGHPPICRFQWGTINTFKAIVQSVDLTFTMFLPDGTPVRAKAKVSLKEYEDEGIFPRQNPTSASEARKIWVVIEGETLDWIAHQEYGDAGRWRHIAAVNNLDNPKDLRAGQVLNLPPLPA